MFGLSPNINVHIDNLHKMHIEIHIHFHHMHHMYHIHHIDKIHFLRVYQYLDLNSITIFAIIYKYIHYFMIKIKNLWL